MTTVLEPYGLGDGGYQFADKVQKDMLDSLLAQANRSAQSDPGVGAIIYNYLLSQIGTIIADPSSTSALDVPANGVNVAVYDWIEAAAGINGGTSIGGQLIEEYTAAVYKIWNGNSLDPRKFYAESNRIAINVVNSIEANGYNLPDIYGIAAADAGATASTLFGNVYCPWAGTALFAFLSAPDLYSQWLLTNDTVVGTVPDVSAAAPGITMGVTFKSIPGTYSLIATLEAFSKVHNLTLALNALYGGNTTSNPSSLGLDTEKWLRAAYGVTEAQFPNLGWGTPFAALKYPFAPNYVAGTANGNTVITLPSDNPYGIMVVGGPGANKIDVVVPTTGIIDGGCDRKSSIDFSQADPSVGRLTFALQTPPEKASFSYRIEVTSDRASGGDNPSAPVDPDGGPVAYHTKSGDFDEFLYEFNTVIGNASGDTLQVPVLDPAFWHGLPSGMLRFQPQKPSDPKKPKSPSEKS